MNRRRVIGMLASAVALGPHALRAQPESPRRIGALMGYAEEDAMAQGVFGVFKRALAEHGWIEGRTLRLDARWSRADLDRAAALAREIVASRPDVIVTSSTPATAAIQRETSKIPVVFIIVSDPVGSGFVKSLARPGGNMTGVLNLESSLIGKWLELLREIAPATRRVAVLFNPETSPYRQPHVAVFEEAATKSGVKLVVTPVRSAAEIESVLATLGREPGGALIVLPDSFLIVHRKVVLSAAAQHRVPVVYNASLHVREGGLISYGEDIPAQLRTAADYVDRILRGADAGEIPVAQPTKFELVVNLKSARALGLDVPQSLLLRADQVIE